MPFTKSVSCLTVLSVVGFLPYLCDALAPGTGVVIFGLRGHKLNTITCAIVTVMGEPEPAFMDGRTGNTGKPYYVCDVLSRRSSTVELRVRLLPSGKHQALSQECVIIKRDELKPEFWLEPAKVIEGSAKSGCLFVTDVPIEGRGWILRLAFYSSVLTFFTIGIMYVARRLNVIGKLRDRFWTRADWDEVPFEVRNPANQNDVQLEVLNPASTATWDDVTLEERNPA